MSIDMKAVITADPMDSLARVAYADWLEEQGGEKNLEMAQVQRKIADYLQSHSYKRYGAKSMGCFARISKRFGYRKRELVVSVATEVSIDGTYWDGGSRSSYQVVTLIGVMVHVFPQYAPPQFGGPPRPPIHKLEKRGEIVVETGRSGGKEATIRIYIHPDDILAFFAA